MPPRSTRTTGYIFYYLYHYTIYNMYIVNFYVQYISITLYILYSCLDIYRFIGSFTYQSIHRFCLPNTLLMYHKRVTEGPRMIVVAIDRCMASRVAAFELLSDPKRTGTQGERRLKASSAEACCVFVTSTTLTSSSLRDTNRYIYIYL